MNISQTAQRLVVATPGLTLRQLATALDMTPRKRIVTLSAMLTQIVKAGKLRRDGDGSGPARYFPTALTGTDNRRLKRKAGTRASRAAERKAAATPAAAPVPAYASTNARKPRQASQVRIAKPPRPLPPPRVACQSVEDFVANGGRIQHLSPYATSNPLRFDHSRTESPGGRRRGAACHRKAGAQ